MPKYYEISEAAAKRAKDMNSYSDYAPGSATAGYRAMVDEAYALAEKQKARVDPMYHDKIDALVDRYARRLAENLNERNAIDARVPSILITGGGNFPVAKKAKQNAARDRNYGEYAEIEKLLDKIRSTGRGGISADDDLAAVLSLPVGYFLGTLGMVDYYGSGVVTVLIFYLCRQIPYGWIGEVAGLAFLNCKLLGGMTIPLTLGSWTLEFPEQGLALLALIPIWLYNGRQGAHNKAIQYACYAFYPAHMLILALLRMYL